MLREFFKDTLEKKIQVNDEKIQELQAKIALLDAETEKVFEQLEVSPQQIEQFLSDKSNFNDSQWEEVQRQITEIESKANGYRDIIKTKRAYQERAEIKREWLFVR